MRTVTRLSSNRGRIGQQQSRPDPKGQVRSTTELSDYLRERGNAKVPYLSLLKRVDGQGSIHPEYRSLDYTIKLLILTIRLYTFSQYDQSHDCSVTEGKRYKGAVNHRLARCIPDEARPVARLSSSLGTRSKRYGQSQIGQKPDETRSVTRLSSSQTTEIEKNQLIGVSQRPIFPSILPLFI